MSVSDFGVQHMAISWRQVCTSVNSIQNKLTNIQVENTQYLILGQHYSDHPDQLHFVKQRFTSDNLKCLFNVIDAASKLLSLCVVLSVQAEKASDRPEWKYLW